jgi:hypothetical protein
MQITEHGEFATVGRIDLNAPGLSTVTETNPAKAYLSKLHSDPIIN